MCNPVMCRDLIETCGSDSAFQFRLIFAVKHNGVLLFPISLLQLYFLIAIVQTRYAGILTKMPDYPCVRCPPLVVNYRYFFCKF